MEIITSGAIHLDGFNVNPVQVAPGGDIKVTFKFRETATFVGYLTRGSCEPGGLFSGNGLKTNIRIDPEWMPEVSDSFCMPVYNTGDASKEMSYMLKAPSDVEEETDYNIVFSMQKPGKPESSAYKTVTVKPDTSEEGEPSNAGYEDPYPGGDAGGEVPGGGDNGGDVTNTLVRGVINNPVKAGIGAVGLGIGFKLFG